jgi:hypothetical protein
MSSKLEVVFKLIVLIYFVDSQVLAFLRKQAKILRSAVRGFWPCKEACMFTPNTA